MQCPACGRQIEPDARFCRYCGARQEERTRPVGVMDPPASAKDSSPSPGSEKPAPYPSWFELRVRHLFPRHALQDEFMHILTMVAFLIALVGFIFGFFRALYGLATTWLLFAIALFLFLMLRESTLSHIRRPDRAEHAPPHARSVKRQVAPPPEAATAESSPPRPTA